MNIGEIWCSNDFKEFIIEDIFFKDEESWVSYRSINTETTYSCLSSAFKNRFFKK